MIVVRTNLSVLQGERWRFDDRRSFVYLTNEWVPEANALVFEAHDRCHQDNRLAPLSGGVRALRAPLDNLTSNWADLVLTALAWDLTAWWALRRPERPGRWQERHRAAKQGVLRLEFQAFVNAFVRLPCQLVRTGRRLVSRLLAWHPPWPILFRRIDSLRCGVPAG